MTLRWEQILRKPDSFVCIQKVNEGPLARCTGYGSDARKSSYKCRMCVSATEEGPEAGGIKSEKG